MSAPEALQEMLAKMRANNNERRELARQAPAALDQLIKCMVHKTGQGYKLRSLLWSLYNGKPASLLDVLGLDWELRKALITVLAAFGFEPGPRGAGSPFFYDAIKEQVTKAGLWDWFILEDWKEAE